VRVGELGWFEGNLFAGVVVVALEAHVGGRARVEDIHEDEGQ
jgi:hypothetical protein